MSISVGIIGSSGYGGEQKLTAATKAKLERLGIDTSNVETEAEGRMLLKIAVQERIDKSDINNSKNTHKIPQWILEIANEMNVACTNEDNSEKIINNIILILEEKISNTDNFAEKTQYTEKLKKIKLMSNSQNSLSVAMEQIAHINVTYFGLKQPKAPSS